MSTSAPTPPVLCPADREWLDRIIELLRSRMAHDRPPGTTTSRIAHAKAHACVPAEFVVAADVPPDLRVGLFAAQRDPRVNPRRPPSWDVARRQRHRRQGDRRDAERR